MTIFDLLDQVAFLRGAPAVAVVLLAALVAVVAWDVSLRLGRNAAAGAKGRVLSANLLVFPAIFVLYLVSGLLFVDVLDPRLAVVTVIAGFFTALILLVTGWQVNWGRPPHGLTAEEMACLKPDRVRTFGPLTVTDRALLRLALSAAVLVAVLWASRTAGTLLPELPDGAAYIEAAVLGLAGLGLVGLAASTEPLPGGIGLLIFLQGFALYYSMVDPSLTMVVALVVLQLAIALAASHLAQARFAPTGALD